MGMSIIHIINPCFPTKKKKKFSQKPMSFIFIDKCNYFVLCYGPSIHDMVFFKSLRTNGHFKFFLIFLFNRGYVSFYTAIFSKKVKVKNNSHVYYFHVGEMHAEISFQMLYLCFVFLIL